MFSQFLSVVIFVFSLKVVCSLYYRVFRLPHLATRIKPTMATHGTINPYDPQDDWATYEERLRHYFVANGVEDAGKKRSILLTVCGTPTYKLLRSLVEVGELNTKSFDELARLLKEHYDPKPSAIVQRFNTRTRAQGESISAFVAALRDLALHCEYGETLSQMLRDGLVCGVNHEGIQRKLLAEKDLTYDRAYSLAQMAETAEKDAKKLKGGQTFKGALPAAEHELHYSSSPSPTQPPSPHAANSKGFTPTCFRCGGPHLAPQCLIHRDEVECGLCGKKGHIAKVCKSKTAQDRQPRRDDRRQPRQDNRRQFPQRKPGKNTHYLEQQAPVEDDVAYGMFSLSDPSAHPEPYRLDVTLNGIPTQMELDTGASVSLISSTTYERIKSAETSLQPSKVALKTYTGQCIQVLGISKVMVKYGEKEMCLSVHMVSGDGPNPRPVLRLGSSHCTCGKEKR